MKIQCLLLRPGGTIAEVGGIDYHFKPQPDGSHIAEVKDEIAIERFLSIKEGYAEVTEGGSAKKAAKADNEAAIKQTEAEVKAIADKAEADKADKVPLDTGDSALETKLVVAPVKLVAELSRQEKAAITRAANKAKVK